MEPSREEIRRWIRDILEQSQETPTALARKAGIASTTLTRFLNEQDKTVLSFRTIAKIAHAAGVSPIGLAPAPRQQARGFELEASPHDISDMENPSHLTAIEALIRGRPAATPWVLQSYTLENAGYLQGDILIVDLNAKPKAGDIVCVQAFQWSQGKSETIFRIYEPPYLVSATNDPNFRKPLLVDNDRIIIKGVVTETLRVRID